MNLFQKLSILIIIFASIPIIFSANDNAVYQCTHWDEVGESCVGAFSDCDDSYYGNDGGCVECSYWNIGGSGDSTGYPFGGATLCCGDDSDENRIYRQVDDSVMENGYTSDSNDDACCSASDKCVDSATCYSDGTSNTDADSDGDTDLCTNGIWKDCEDDSDCPAGLYCSQSINDCVSPDGYIVINNLGITGIENSNQEYTSIRTVMLQLDFIEFHVACRYANHDDTTTVPLASEWSPWESCITNKLWQLTENDEQKTVYYQINYSAPVQRIAIFNDSIYYNYTGAGLDTTPPSNPVIIDGYYTNNNHTITINWINASDPESEILGIPLKYKYILYADGTILDNTTTEATSVITSGLDLIHNTTVYANVTVINSAGLTSTKTSNGLKIDLLSPTISNLKGSFLNKSSGIVQPIINSWMHATQVNFSWSANDELSGISSYSYSLSQNPSMYPDNIPESTQATAIYNSLIPGRYYFKIKAKDRANNWGYSLSLNFSVDSTPSTQPSILTQAETNNTITYTWSQAYDSESGITHYMINLTNGESNITTDKSFTFYDLPTGDYQAIVGALNGVGLWRWSDEREIATDFDPPEIIALPNRTVASANPVLKVWTNEFAACFYDSNEFKYTNTTYHETRLQYHNNGHYNYDIKCTDSSGNSAIQPVNFTVNILSPNVTYGPNYIQTYENMPTTLTVHVNQSSIELAGLTNFSVFIDGSEVKSSVFGRGNGLYNVSFIAPSEGSYNLKISVVSSELIATLEVNKIVFSVLYEDSSIISPPNKTKYITYYQASKTIGLASDINLENYAPQVGELNISGIDVNSDIYIFNTKPTANIKDKNNLQSFGYLYNKNPPIRFILDYDFPIKSEIGDRLTFGNQNFKILKTSDPGTVIKFVRRDSNNKIILSSN